MYKRGFSSLLMIALFLVAVISLVSANVAVAADTQILQSQSASNVQSQQLSNDEVMRSAVNATAFGYGSNGKKTSATANSVVPMTSSAVAVVTIFSDPTWSPVFTSGGLSYDGGTHSFISVRNVSTSNITVGKLAVSPNMTTSLGTWWSNVQPLHNGLWYDLEAYKINYNGAYGSRISASYIMTSSEFAQLNAYILSHDSWSPTSNCSTFASGAWNTTVASSYTVSAGIPNTPKNLANGIKSVFPTTYSTGYSLPYNYSVYYANGSNAITQTSSFR